MALTRKFLKAMGIEEEKVEEIISAHSETVDALKEQRDAYKADAEQLPSVKSKLDEAEKQMEAGGKDPYKAKYEVAQKELVDLKAASAQKETLTAKQAAARKLLDKCHIDAKRHDAILRLLDVDGIALAEDGSVKDADALETKLKADWADFVVTDTTKGPSVETPPTGEQKDPEKMSFAEYKAWRKPNEKE